MSERVDEDGVLSDQPEFNEYGVRVKPRRFVNIEDFENYLLSKGLNTDFTENPDPRPMQPPVGYRRQPSMVEHIRNMIRAERLQAELDEAGIETFEEADDFDVPDEDGTPLSGYEFEETFDPPAPSPEPSPSSPASSSVEPAGSAKDPSQAGTEPARGVPDSAST